MYQRLVNFLSRLRIKSYGVDRMNKAISQFQAIVDDLGTAIDEIAQQRAAMDAERCNLLDRIDVLDSKMFNASANMGRAANMRARIAALISG